MERDPLVPCRANSCRTAPPTTCPTPPSFTVSFPSLEPVFLSMKLKHVVGYHVRTFDEYSSDFFSFFFLRYKHFTSHFYIDTSSMWQQLYSVIMIIAQDKMDVRRKDELKFSTFLTLGARLINAIGKNDSYYL